jgi:hypothetical protein
MQLLILSGKKPIRKLDLEQEEYDIRQQPRLLPVLMKQGNQIEFDGGRL